MRARDVMTKSVLAVPSTTAAEAAWQLMRAQGVHHLLVGSASKPEGLVSARDLGGRHGASVRKAQTVGSLMTSGLTMVDELETVRRIANLMRGQSVGCVLVTRDTRSRRVVGIITVSDLLELIGRGTERPVDRTERHALHSRVPHRHRPRAGDGMW